MRTIADLIAQGIATLEQAGVSEPRAKWEWLVACRLGVGRLDWRLIASQEVPSFLDESLWRHDLERLAAGEPLAYVLGETIFHGRKIRCDRRALIPRPETEQLVEEVLYDATLWHSDFPFLADAGTGTGCIACTLAVERLQCRVIALDCRAEILALAAENCSLHGVRDRVVLMAGDWLEPLADRSLDGVISNPPYIADGEWKNLDREVRDFEPREALAGGEDGLAAIRRLAADARRCLKPGGSFWMEMGIGQGESVRRLLTSLGFQAIEIRPDWTGRPRFASARAPE